jgi:hypothetical protein
MNPNQFLTLWSFSNGLDSIPPRVISGSNRGRWRPIQWPPHALYFPTPEHGGAVPPTAAPLSLKARTPVPFPSFDANNATIYGGVSESSRRILTGIQGVESTAPKRSSPAVVMPCRRWTSPAGKAPTTHQRDVPEARDHEERRWHTLRPVVSPPRRSLCMKLQRWKSLSPSRCTPFLFLC